MKSAATSTIAMGFVALAFSAMASEITNQVGNAGFVHKIWTDLIHAEDHCSGLIVDVQKFDEVMRKLVSNHMEQVKGMQLTLQGSAWHQQRKNEFLKSPETNCAQAWTEFGESGTFARGLLKKKS